MANSDAPRGATVVSNGNGSPYNGQAREMEVDASNATAVFPGDFITLEDDGNCAPAAAGGIIYGLCVGVKINPAVAETIHPGYLPASTAGQIYVAVGEDLVFSMQEDSVGGSLALTAVGSNVDIIAGAGSTTTGLSGHEIDSSTSTDGAPGSAQLRIIGLDTRVDNAVGTNAKWLVKVVESHFASATGL